MRFTGVAVRKSSPNAGKSERTTYPDGLPTGQAVLTTAGQLPADYVIHTVGPVYGRNKGRDAEFFAACYENSLVLAREQSITSVAFPAISTGIYGYPGSEAAPVASKTIGSFLATDEALSEIRMVFFKDSDAWHSSKIRNSSKLSDFVGICPIRPIGLIGLIGLIYD